MMIQLTGEEKSRYVESLDLFERIEGAMPTAKERTAAFFWATNPIPENRPYWMK